MRKPHSIWYGLAAMVLIQTGTVDAAASKTINLTASTNVAVLEDDGIPTNRLVRIRSLNSSFATITFELPTSDLIINLGGGDDTLTVNGESITGFTAKITINGGTGNDTAEVSRLTSGSGVCFNDTSGTNQGLNVRSSQLSGQIQVIDGSGSVNLGLNAVTAGSVATSSPDGNLGFFVSNSTINGKVNVDNRGYGTDSLRIDSTQIIGDTWLSLGNGPVTSSSLFATYRGNYSLLGGSGTFTTTFGTCGFRQNCFLGLSEGSTNTSILYVTMTGNLSIRNGLGFDTALLQNLSVNQLNIENGDGGSRTTVVSRIDFPDLFLIPQATIVNGEGTDTFTTNSANPSQRSARIGDLYISNGSGNSVTEILSPFFSVDNLLVSGGNGFDTLSFGGCQLGNLVADLFDGGSQTTFDDSLVDGGVDVFGGAGNDQVWIDGTFLGPFQASLGGGTDWAVLNAGFAYFFSSLVLDGGDGTDTVTNAPFPESFPGYLEIVNFENGL